MGRLELGQLGLDLLFKVDRLHLVHRVDHVTPVLLRVRRHKLVHRVGRARRISPLRVLHLTGHLLLLFLHRARVASVAATHGATGLISRFLYVDGGLGGAVEINGQ